MMTVPNMITLIRIAMIPVFMGVLLSGMPNAELIALIIFIVASATDGIDGYIARKYNLITNFGKFIDPLADKLLVAAAILIFTANGQMGPVAAMLVFAREFIVTSIRLVAVNEGVVIAAAMSGKIKTCTQIVAICLMLTPWREIAIGSVTLNTLAVWAIVIATVWSGVDYIIANRKILMKGMAK